MNLHLEEIKSAADQNFGRLLLLYEESFPTEERRDIEQLKNMFNAEKMQFLSIIIDDKVVGFMILWNFESFTYIEHFAILPTFRGKNIGGQVLKMVSHKSEKILLEAEIPFDEISEKRIKFYQQNEFQILNIDYAQPPYRKGEPVLPMHLLSNTEGWQADKLNSAIELFHEKVYYRNY